MYGQDWDGFIPPHAVGQVQPDLPGQNARLLRAYGPYVHAAAIGRCPSDPLAGQVRIGSYAYHNWSSYAFTGLAPDAPLQRVDDPDHTGRRGPSEVAYAMDDNVYMVIAMTPAG